MATTINILPEQLANKIAAGEVVQRPESVVKELVENSIDAGATSISISVKEGGKSFIQISDNGFGMNDEDAAIAFGRHATSKLKSYEDLENIRTLGFRGEALASIVAVAHVELKTRRAADEVGTLVRIEGGELKDHSKTGTQPGTIISVRNLFYNTPARRHFLKSNNTEFKHIYDVVQRVALSRPDIAIHFISDGEDLLDLRSGTIEERLKNLYGERHFETLIPFSEKTEMISALGFIGKPDFARKSRVDQYLFLNKRSILNRSINHAIFSGYEHLIEKGNFPFYLVFLEIDPQKVDVNVHPSKMEVKFADEQSIYRFVISVVRKALGTNDIVPSLEMNASRNFDHSFASLRHAALPHHFSGDVGHSERGIFSIPSPNFNRENASQSSLTLDKLFSDIPTVPLPEAAKPQQFAHGTRENEAKEGKGIWQLHNKYILSQIRTGLMIIDQHVAHERILYERALASFENAVPVSQQLLFPHTVQLSSGDFALAKELIPHLQALGFELKLFGKNTIVLEGVPTDVKAGMEGSILQDILDEFKNNQHRVKLDSRDNVAKSFSCKAAIKAGDKLSEIEMRVLIDQLFATAMPYVCPHGRPVVVKISLSELDRRFMRTS
ncbi:MAG: DNA mismatch repair endonuclease MutL [Bacteroidota bacterium]